MRLSQPRNPSAAMSWVGCHLAGWPFAGRRERWDPLTLLSPRAIPSPPAPWP